MNRCSLMLLLGTASFTFTPGCSSPQEAVDGIALTAMLTTMVALSPAIPVVGAYNKLTDVEGKAMAEKVYWESLLDPVYQERIHMIEQRSPEADADAIRHAGDVVFFKTNPGSDDKTAQVVRYPGVHNIWSGPPDKATNEELIQSNELAAYLWALLADDPSHPSFEESHYFSEAYHQFLKARWAYIERFNVHMYNKGPATNPAGKSAAEEWWQPSS